MTAEKTSKPVVTQHQQAGGAFFRKAAEEGFFGNQQTPSFFSPVVQPKLSVSQPDDPQEKEADQVADHVMRMPEASTPMPADDERKDRIFAKLETPVNISRQAEEGEVQAKSIPHIQRQATEDGEDKVMPKLSGASATHAYLRMPGHSPPTIIQRKGRDPPQPTSSFATTLSSTKGAGTVMPATARGFMERRFGADFSSVRIHTGSNAVMLNRAINAQAFTHGADIYFNSGKFQPESSAGKSLLAHELTHTVQQGAAMHRKTASAPPINAPPANAFSRKGTDKKSDSDSGTVQRSISDDIDLSGMSGGSELSQEARDYLQDYYKVSLGDIRIHTDIEAAGICASAGVSAFTQGTHICMFPSAYQPETEDGAILLSKQVSISLKQRGLLVGEAAASGIGGLLQQITAAIKEQQAAVPATDKTKASAPGIPESAPLPPAGKKKVSGNKAAKGSRKGKKKGDSDDADIAIPAKKGAKKKSPSKPSEDPAFQKVIRKTKKTAKDQRQHDPAEHKADDAQKAAGPVPNEAESKAQNRKTDALGEAAKKDKPFDAAAFKKELLQKIESLTPQTLEDAVDFKENNKIGEVKGAMGAKVAEQKEGTTGPVTKTAAEDLHVAEADNKQPETLPPTLQGTKPAGVGAKDAAPKPKLADEISMQEQSKSLDEDMKANNITEKQLTSSNEPSFAAALDEKKSAQKDAAEKPKEYQKEETGLLKEAKADAQQDAGKALSGMHAARGKNFMSVAAHQQTAKSSDEEKRAKVASDIEAMYQVAEGKVTTALKEADDESNRIFDQGSEAARTAFENYVDERMRAYKEDRYSGFWGGLRWAKDKLFGMPKEVDKFYTEGRELYLQKMDEVITQVANVVTTKLNDAKQAITDGKAEIDKYVAKLPKDLQDVGKEAATNIQDKFDSLELAVNDKKDALKDSLAKKYVDNLKQLDDRIEEMKEANQGLVDKAIGFLKKVWKVIKDLTNLFMTILARLASIISVVIGNPGGFFKNLGKAFITGLNRFKDKFVDYLEQGLMIWLSTNLGIAGIELPEKFDIASVFGLALQVMGITKQHVTERAIALLGQEKVQLLLGAGGILYRISQEGFGALWDMIYEKLTDFKDLIWESIKSFIQKKIIEEAIKFILMMFNPIGAFIKVCMAVYDFLMMLVRFKDRIIELLDTILNAVINIASGQIDAAAKAIEAAFAKSIPVIIGFLAALLHLNDIAAAIRGIITRIRAKVDKGIDFVIMKSYSIVGKGVEFALRAKDKGMAMYEKGKEKVIAGATNIKDAVTAWYKSKLEFKAKDGSRHKLYFKGEGAGAALTIESTPTPFTTFLSNVHIDPKDEKVSEKTAAKTESLRVAGEVETLKATSVEGASKEITEANEKAKTRAVAVKLQELSTYTSILFDIAMPMCGEPVHVPSSDSMSSFAMMASIKPLCLRGLSVKHGSEPDDKAHEIYATLALRRDGGKTYYRKGHLLNQGLKGEGTWKNMTPLSAAGNSAHESQAESLVKAAVDSGAVVEYIVRPVYPGSRGDKAALKQQMRDNDVPSLETKLQIVDAEDNVPTAMDCNAWRLNDKLERVQPIVNKQVPNPVKRSPNDYVVDGEAHFSKVKIDLNFDRARKMIVYGNVPEGLAALIVNARAQAPTGRFNTYKALADAATATIAQKDLKAAYHGLIMGWKDNNQFSLR